MVDTGGTPARSAVVGLDCGDGITPDRDAVVTAAKRTTFRPSAVATSEPEHSA